MWLEHLFSSRLIRGFMHLADTIEQITFFLINDSNEALHISRKEKKGCTCLKFIEKIETECNKNN